MRSPASRRRIAFAAVVALVAIGLIAAFRDMRPAADAELAEVDFFAMNTTGRVSLAGTEDDANVAADIVSQLEARLSAFLPSSDVARLNAAAGMAVSVEPQTYRAISEAVRWARETGGAFDPTVGPVVRLWRDAGKSGRLPSEAEIEAARALVGYEKIDLARGDEVALESPGVTIDLGGIAKGYAADIAAARLRERGVKSALIDLGGNILVVGSRLDGSPWGIGVQRPGSPRGEAIGVVELLDASMVTSGPYERFIDIGGVRYHHIFDPRTGRPVDTDLASVTVIAKSSTDADALATAFSVMGVESSREFLAKHSGYAAIFIVRDGDKLKIFITPGVLEKTFHALGDNEVVVMGER